MPNTLILSQDVAATTAEQIGETLNAMPVEEVRALIAEIEALALAPKRQQER